jgi:KaiC/GvpD/RAD55 family RecA-like ATPase
MADDENESELEKKAQDIMARMQSIISEAKGEEEGKVFDKPLNVTLNALITKPSEITSKKKLVGFATGTFLDKIFLDNDGKEIGLPMGANMLLSGLPSSGKSLFIREVILRVANSGVKVVFATSEEVWKTEGERYDLETRFFDTAKLLGLDWSKIKENLIILDLVKFAELRDFDSFITAYRTLIEKEGVKFLAIDSISMLEDSRGMLKVRLTNLCRYNQKYGVTSLIIVQRATDEADGMNLSGGLALSHIADVLGELDYKKAWSSDGNLKQDTGCKQGDIIYFFRIQKCRLSRYDARYKKYSITSDGLVRLV